MRVFILLLAMLAVGLLNVRAEDGTPPKPARRTVVDTYVLAPPDKPRRVEIARKRVPLKPKRDRDYDVWAGILDLNGNFVPYPGQKPKRYDDLKSRPNLINLHRGAGGPANEIIYEYRSGLLIPGMLDGYGNFVPKNKGEIIDFKDYEKLPGRPTIWNFPGKLGTEERDVKP